MEKLLNCALDIGEQMLICGGEVHRVEDSIRRICLACNAKRVDLFIITSSIIATLVDGNGLTYTQTREVKNIAPDMEQLHKLNELSRKICNDGKIPNDFKERIETAKNGKKYPKWFILMAYAAMAAAFTMFFGGTWIEGVSAFFAGGIIYFATVFAEKAHMNNVFSKFFASILAAIFTFVVFNLGFVPGVDKMMIGCIMLLIPGTGLTNALRDLFVGDSIAGMLRTTDAVLSALAIAAGYLAVTFIMGGAA